MKLARDWQTLRRWKCGWTSSRLHCDGEVAAKGARVLRAIGVLVLAIVFMTSTAACASTSPVALRSPTPTVPTSYSGHIGTIVELGNWRYAVQKIDTSLEAFTCGDVEHSVRKPKGMWVVILLDLTNIGRESLTLRTHDIELRDDKGAVYTMPTFLPGSCSRGRGQRGGLEEPIAASFTLRTTLLYDVAPETSGMYLYLVQGGGTIRLA